MIKIFYILSICLAVSVLVSTAYAAYISIKDIQELKLYQNKHQKVFKSQKPLILVHHYYKELILDKDTIITYVDSITVK